MTANLEVLLQQGESQTLEFKESFGEEALETICSFANADGGITLIGVEDDGTVCGVSVGKRTIEDWANQIQNATDPRLQPAIQAAEKDGKQIAVILVEPSSGLPVSVKARFLRRVGRTNQRMSHAEIMQRLYASSGSSWDAVAETGTTIRDLDLDKVRAFLIEVRKIGRRLIPEATKADEALEKLGLIHSDVPTRAALLFFGKNTTSHFPAAYVKLGRFRSPTLIVDDRRVDGGILQQIDDCLSWFRERLQTEFVITGKPQRDVIWEYPLDAVREAMINAICHRDYRVNANIQVRLYDERLEIWNPGGLPTPLTPKMLIEEHDSMPRNRLLADCLFYCGLIENWGTGTTRIVTLLSNAGLAPPDFNVAHQDSLRVTFSKDRFSAAGLHELGVNERQFNAVGFIRTQKRMTNGDYQKLCGVSERTASRELNQLVALDILVRQGGTGKGTFYVLSNDVTTPKAPQSRKGAKDAIKTP